MPKHLLLIVSLLLSSGAQAQQRDPSFHNAHFQRGSSAATVTAVVRQADGKYIVTGNFSTVDGHATRKVARLLADGRPDLSFAYAASASWRPTESAGSVAVQPDGQVLVALADSAQALLRLLPDGSRDAAFGLAVPVALQSKLRTYCSAVLVQPDGRIVVAGQQTLVRLSSTGQLDPTFLAPQFGTDVMVRSVCLEPDGRLTYITSNHNYLTSNDDISSGRLLPDGRPDASFTPLALSQADASQLRRLRDGRYLVSGVFRMQSGNLGHVIRLSATGAIDSTFTSYAMGITFTSPWVQSPVWEMEEQPDGRILVAGYHLIASGGRTPVALCRPDGLPVYNQGVYGFDPECIYTLGGIAGLPQSAYNAAVVNDLLVEPSGKVLVAGRFERAGGQPSYGLTRLLAAGALAATAPAAAQLQLWPNPAHDQLHLRFDAAASPRRVALLDALGRTVLTGPASPEVTLSLNTSALARGLYLLRVDYANGPVTRRVVLE